MQHGSLLYYVGVSYYAHGTIKQGRKVQAYYYKLCKPATNEQVAEIRKQYPCMQTGMASAQYAPEQVATVLIFPSKAEIKRQAK